MYDKEFKYFKVINYRDIVIFLIPFLIFSYYLYIFNPGIVTYDSYNQLHQIATNSFTNWHPFFHTFIEMICIRIFGTPMSIGALQILIFSIIWMIICKFNRNDHLNSKQFILQVLLTLIISLIPINAIYSITLWKDILFSYSILFLCFLIKYMLDKNLNISLKFIIVFSLTMSFVWQLRPNGIFIIIGLLIILAVYFLKNNKNKKTLFLIVSLTIIFALSISLLNVTYDVKDIDKDAVYDRTVHILSYYELNNEMEDSDKEKLHEIISEKDIKNQFNIYYTDPTYHSSNSTPYENNKMEYLSMVMKYSIKNPKSFVKYFLKSSSIVWDITRDDDWEGFVYYTNIETGKNSFYERFNTNPKTQYDNASHVNFGTDKYNQLNSIVEIPINNKILDTLFNSPALYMYMSFILMGLMYFMTNSRKIFIVYLPNLLNILTILVSTPIQANRYLYSNLLVFYFLVVILIGIKIK